MSSNPAIQPPLFHMDQVVNVASVPKLSPFRYAGGKTWLVPRIRQWLASQPTRPLEIIEPFAGGGIVSLTAVFENLVERALMVELDEQVGSVWSAILGGDAEWLAERIASFDVTPESVAATLAETGGPAREKAFRTILRNRVNRGGILAPGAGLIKYGEEGKGLKSRWYPETLKKRILAIGEHRDRIRFVQGDGLQVLKENAQRTNVVYFIDPPYTASTKGAGRRLYSHSEIDHEALFTLAGTLRGDFLMTYDQSPEVENLAQIHGFDMLRAPMKNTHHATIDELLVGRGLSWARKLGR
jgi:DNA adenine methylase